MASRKNILVFSSGDVYDFASVDTPSDWMINMSLTYSNVTLLQGPVFDRLEMDDYVTFDESTMDVLHDWLTKSRDDAPNDYQLARTVIQQHGGDFEEFLALALAEGSALLGEFLAIHESRYDAYDIFLRDRYGIDSDSEIFMYGLAELDMDAVSDQYDADSGNVLLQGRDKVYEVSY